MTDKISPGNQLKKNDSFLFLTVFCQDSEEIRKIESGLANDCLYNIVKLLLIGSNIPILNLISQ